MVSPRVPPTPQHFRSAAGPPPPAPGPVLTCDAPTPHLQRVGGEDPRPREGWSRGHRRAVEVVEVGDAGEDGTRLRGVGVVLGGGEWGGAHLTPHLPFARSLLFAVHTPHAGHGLRDRGTVSPTPPPAGHTRVHTCVHIWSQLEALGCTQEPVPTPPAPGGVGSCHLPAQQAGCLGCDMGTPGSPTGTATVRDQAARRAVLPGGPYITPGTHGCSHPR